MNILLFLRYISGIRFLESLQLSSLVTSNLNPLRVCLPTIATAFSSITRVYQLVYCHPILERNARRQLTTIYKNDSQKPEDCLETYFPFDPYLLKMYVILSLYRRKVFKILINVYLILADPGKKLLRFIYNMRVMESKRKFLKFKQQRGSAWYRSPTKMNSSQMKQKIILKRDICMSSRINNKIVLKHTFGSTSTYSIILSDML